jgi:hypothetical protein
MDANCKHALALPGDEVGCGLLKRAVSSGNCKICRVRIPREGLNPAAALIGDAIPQGLAQAMPKPCEGCGG